MMIKHTVAVVTAGLVSSTVMSSPAVGQEQDMSDNLRQQAQQLQQRSDESRERGQQSLEQIRQRERQENRQDGSRQVQVEERALWGLGELPPELMHRAMEKLVTDPREAKLSVMQAANILQLQAALGQGSPQSQQLEQAAEQLRDVAQRIEYKQILNKDELRRPFANASLTAAAFYQQAAERGLQQRDAEQTGYTLKGAAEYLSVAHTFVERKPSEQVSEAAYNASTLAEQIVRASKPTTYDPDGAQLTNRGADEDRAQPAGGRQGREAEEPQSIPQNASRIIQDLGQAIQQTGGANGAMQQQGGMRQSQ